MKHFLRLPAFFILMLVALTSQSQVTQLSNNTNIRSGVALGNTGIMADKDGALWRTEGTAGGTVQYSSKVLIDTTVQLAVWNNKIYFSGTASGSGEELWVTDGTDAGTHIVKDIEAGATSSMPVDLIVFNNELYFFATTAGAGTELWKSDGTQASTSLVKDINPGAGSSYDAAYTSFFALNNILYFDANDGTDGTELWKTDGTNGNTFMLLDINAGAGSSNCGNFTALGSTVLFDANDGTHGDELWKTDGTIAGTSMVKDIVSGNGSSSPQQFVPFNNTQVLFLTLTGFLNYKLYLTDGSSGGTTLVKDFGSLGIAIIATSVIINNKLYFTASDLTHGAELWSSDGTTAGTTIFKDIASGNSSSTPIILPDFLSLLNGSTNIHTKLFNDKIFFIADDGTHGIELWITDGTLANTKMVKDINPGSGSGLGTANISWFYTASSFYFAADNGTTGNELYVTDGTGANTSLVEDINPGSGSSNPFMFMFLSNHIYLTADDGDGGANTDLYKVDASVTLPVNLVAFTATTDGKVVNLQWSTVTETNAKNFVVQRSGDAVHFDNIGTVNAKGNSTSKTDYHFIDGGALSTGAKTIYYRLQMADNDGKSAYSKIADVELLPGNNFFAVYPNPVKDKLVIITSNAVNAATIKVTDQTGKIVITQQLENIQAGTKNTINVSALGNGIYYMQIISGNNKQTVRFVKY